MMIRLTQILGASALVAATPLAAQSPADIDPQSMSAAVRYALPLAFDGFIETCSAQLSPSGYALRNENNLRAKFNDGIDAAWPPAKAALVTIASDGEGMGNMFEMLDDDTLRPFVDGLVKSLVQSEIKTKDCSNIERGMEILDPMPVENIAQLAGFLAEVGLDGRSEETRTTSAR